MAVPHMKIFFLGSISEITFNLYRPSSTDISHVVFYKISHITFVEEEDTRAKEGEQWDGGTEGHNPYWSQRQPYGWSKRYRELNNVLTPWPMFSFFRYLIL